jgi:hypothetical protein
MGLLLPMEFPKSRLSGLKSAIKPSRQRARRAPVQAEEWAPAGPILVAGWVMWVPSAPPPGQWVPKVAGVLWGPKIAQQCGRV